MLTGQHLVQDHAQPVNIGRFGNSIRLPRRLFGGHVLQSSGNHPRLGMVTIDFIMQPFGQPEVGQLRLNVFPHGKGQRRDGLQGVGVSGLLGRESRQEHIARLDVPVQYPQRVGHPESLGNHVDQGGARPGGLTLGLAGEVLPRLPASQSSMTRKGVPSNSPDS